VWMTPGLDWRAEYGAWPVAAAKLAYVSRTMAELRDKDPEVTSTDLDALRELIEAGSVTPKIDRAVGLEQVPEAIRDLADGRVQGKVVIAMTP